MRKKSPASIQKWVNSVPTEACANEPPIEVEDPHEPEQEITISKQDKPDKDLLAECDISSELEKYPNPIPIQTASTLTEENTNDNKKSNSYHENLKEIGKQKINEFYDRFSKNKKIDLKNLLKTSVTKLKPSSTMDVDIKTDIVEKIVEVEDSENKENLVVDDPPEKPGTSTSLDENRLCVSKNLSIGAIGRSSSENPQSKINSKRFKLNDIGRSFSVQEPEDPKKMTSEISDNFIYDIDDESSSKSNLAPSLATSARSINSANNLSSFVKSVPISPINKTFRDELLSESHSPRHLRNAFLRDQSFQSDSSHCSSVESLLDSRKPNAEEILINLGFGPSQTEDLLSKIPVRFLKPSEVSLL